MLAFQPLEDNDNMEENKELKHQFYKPLPYTNESWTIYDIRRGLRSNYTLVGVSDNVDFDVDISDVMPSSRNRTLESKILVYNRVPKCASTSMQSILRQLSHKIWQEENPISRQETGG